MGGWGGRGGVLIRQPGCVPSIYGGCVKELQVKNGAPLKGTGGAGRDEWNLVGL